MSATPATAPVRVGLLGCGNVGGGLVQLLVADAEVITARTGLRLEVARVAVRNVAKERQLPLSETVLTHDAAAVASDPSIDVVVEVIGGIEPARSLILTALKSGKPVVTANKELMANVGAELAQVAAANNVDLLYEAAVGGGIPIIRPLRESLAGERVRRLMGIVNGTTNYILTRMTEEGTSYAEALAEAQSLGYAERDPTADVEGFDAGAKLAILATIAFGAEVVAGDVYREGISGITEHDIAVADRLGYVVKLLALAEQTDAGAASGQGASGQGTSGQGASGQGTSGRAGPGPVAVRVHPAMLPKDHPLAAVRGSFNAVFVEGEAVGELMFYGRGAGGAPSASAVLGDLIDAAHNLRTGGASRSVSPPRASIRPIDELRSQYYLSIDVVDRPGVLAAVAQVFGAHNVSIRSMEQTGLADEARLIFITHTARESDVQATIGGLHQLDVVKRVGSILRVAGPE